jgi:hypothetical protein
MELKMTDNEIIELMEIEREKHEKALSLIREKCGHDFGEIIKYGGIHLSCFCNVCGVKLNIESKLGGINDQISIQVTGFTEHNQFLFHETKSYKDIVERENGLKRGDDLELIKEALR